MAYFPTPPLFDALVRGTR